MVADASVPAVLILIFCFKTLQNMSNSGVIEECAARPVACYSIPGAYITHNATWQFVRLDAASPCFHVCSCTS